MDEMWRFHEKRHLNHFEMEFDLGLGLPQKEDSLVAVDRVVDLDVV